MTRALLVRRLTLLLDQRYDRCAWKWDGRRVAKFDGSQHGRVEDGLEILLGQCRAFDVGTRVHLLSTCTRLLLHHRFEFLFIESQQGLQVRSKVHLRSNENDRNLRIGTTGTRQPVGNGILKRLRIDDAEAKEDNVTVGNTKAM